MEITFENIILPKIIYKYRDWNIPEHQRILTHNEIYFSSPRGFKNEYECNLPKDYDSVTQDMLYKYFYQSSLNEGKTEKEKDEIASEMVKNSPFHLKSHRVCVEQLFKETLYSRLSIFCVSEHNNNLELWNKFGANQTGFCVGINPIQMFKSSDTFGSGGKVHYYPIKTPPKIRPFCFSECEKIEDMLKVIYNLPDSLKEENEYRLTKTDIEKRAFTIPSKCFEELILGSKISERNKIEIVSIVKTNLPNCLVYQAYYDINKKTFTFEKE